MPAHCISVGIGPRADKGPQNSIIIGRYVGGEYVSPNFGKDENFSDWFNVLLSECSRAAFTAGGKKENSSPSR